MTSASPSRRRLASRSLPSGDLPGRSVGLSRDIPAEFDTPLAAHHRAIGRWVAAQGDGFRAYTRPEAQKQIERTFDAAVMDILSAIEMVDLRAVVINATEDHGPALALICDTVGQVELGWIEKSNVLSQTLQGPVAPVGWRAAAYKALCDTLPAVLPVFHFDDLLEEIAMYYWDGATEDQEAIKNMVEWHGHSLDDLDEEMLPSAVRARRPDWMLTESASALKKLPTGLRQRMRAVRTARDAVTAQRGTGGAWNFNSDLVFQYLPEFEERSMLAPMTLVCADAFARELDDVGRPGMEMGFMDIVGLLPLNDAGSVDAWFQSLKVGAEFLRAAQDLIMIDPTEPGARR
jgi:hypothetical protein